MKSHSQNRLVGGRYGRYEHFATAPVQSKQMGASAFCIFVKTQNFIKASMSRALLNDFSENMQQTGFDSEHVFVHASYDLNLCEWNQRLRLKYLKQLIAELNWSREMGFSPFNLHIGSSPSKLPTQL